MTPPPRVGPSHRPASRDLVSGTLPSSHLAMRRHHPVIVPLVFVLALAGCGSPPPCPECVVLQDVTVIDGLGNAPVAHQTVVVRAGRIEGVYDADGYRPPPGADVRDLPGRFVLPGLIDTHAHVTVLPPVADGGLGDHMDREASEETLRTLLAFGVTSVRNPAAPLPDGPQLRDAVASGAVLGPTIRTAGPIVHAWRPDRTPHDSASVRDEVRRQAAAGVDYVKVYASVPPELLAAVVDEAHRQGLEVVGHLQRTTWTEAARIGIDHVTHGAPWSAAYLPDSLRAGYTGSTLARLDWLAGVDLDGPALAESVRTLAEAGVTVDPTLVAYHTKHWGDDARYLQDPDSVYAPALVRADWRRGTFVDDWTPADFARAKAAWPVVLGITRRLYEGGVTLAVGSDLPNPWVVPGASVHDEMALLHSAGIPALDVLRMATHNGAVVLGLADRTGSVEPGKEADLVILTADPLADLANTRSIEWVVLDGRVLSPDSLLRPRQ